MRLAAELFVRPHCPRSYSCATGCWNSTIRIVGHQLHGKAARAGVRARRERRSAGERRRQRATATQKRRYIRSRSRPALSAPQPRWRDRTAVAPGAFWPRFESRLARALAERRVARDARACACAPSRALGRMPSAVCRRPSAVGRRPSAAAVAAGERSPFARRAVWTRAAQRRTCRSRSGARAGGQRL